MDEARREGAGSGLSRGAIVEDLVLRREDLTSPVAAALLHALGSPLSVCMGKEI